jgi:hypothetical protein
MSQSMSSYTRSRSRSASAASCKVVCVAIDYQKFNRFIILVLADLLPVGPCGFRPYNLINTELPLNAVISAVQTAQETIYLCPTNDRHKLPRPTRIEILSKVYGVEVGFVLKFYDPMLTCAPDLDG